MSQQNLDLVTRAFTAANARPKPDYSTMNELFAADHVLVPVGVASGIEQEATGVEGFRAWRRHLEEFLPVELALQGAVDVGPDKVLTVWTARFKGKASEAASDQRLWAVVTVRGGQLIRTEAFGEPEKAVRAAAESRY